MTSSLNHNVRNCEQEAEYSQYKSRQISFVEDTDGDGCKESTEIGGGRYPLSRDPQGDINADSALDLQDAIMALKVL